MKLWTCWENIVFEKIIALYNRISVDIFVAIIFRLRSGHSVRFNVNCLVERMNGNIWKTITLVIALLLSFPVLWQYDLGKKF